MLSNGEYVIRANAVKTIGVDTLNKLNQADRLGFASGGMVRHFKGGGYNGYADGGYIPREGGLPSNERLPADTANFQDMHGWMVARPGAGVNKHGDEIYGYTRNEKTGKYTFDSAADAYRYYRILLKNRRALVPHIEEKYQEHLNDGWMFPDDSNNYRISNLVSNKTYGPFNGLTQVEARTFAKSISALYGKKSLPKMWKQFGLDPKLLGKPIKLSPKIQRLYNLFAGEITPSLSDNAPRFSYYANGGLVGYKDGGKAYPGAWSTSYLTQEQKDKQARNKLYKKGGYEGFEAGFNSWVQDLMGNPVVGGALKGIGDYLEHDKVTNFALSSLSLPMNIIGSGVNSVMDTIANAQKGKWQDALLSTTGIPRLGDAFASSYGHIFDPSHQYKSQFEVAAQTVIDNKWFGTADSNQAALARIIGGSLNVAADPTVYLGAGLATKAAGAASLASKAGRSAVSAGTKVKDAVKTAVAIKSAKNALKAAGTWADNFYEPGVGMVGGTQGIAEKVGNLTPRLGFNLSDDALQSMIKENFYGNMRTGTRSSTSDSLVNRIAVEKSMMGIAEDAPASMTPAYGFLTTKENMLMTEGSVWNRGAQTSSQQAINNFNQLINPYSRYLQRYGSNTIKLKPNTLGKATISMGDSLSIWDKALGLGQKIPKVNKLSSLASSYPRLHGILESTRNMMRTDIPNIKSPANFPYIEAHLPGGFTVKDIESIILHPTERFGPHATEKIAADLAERRSALDSLLESLGIKGIDITTNPGKQFIDSVLPSKAPRKKLNWEALFDTMKAARRSVGPNELQPIPKDYVGSFGPGRYYGTNKNSLFGRWDSQYGQNISKIKMTPSGTIKVLKSKGYAPYDKYQSLAIASGDNTVGMNNSVVKQLMQEGYIGLKNTDEQLLTSWILGDVKGLGIKNLGEWTANNLWKTPKNLMQLMSNMLRNTFKSGSTLDALTPTSKLMAERFASILKQLKKKSGSSGDDVPFAEGSTGGLLLNGKFFGGFANGGMVSNKYALGGLAMGTDTVPAMLTPGEFVIKKSAVDRIGSSTLNQINRYSDGGLVGGTSTDLANSVYNNTYEINVNVSSASNPNDIANAVMRQIKQIDNGRVRGLGR